MYQSLLRKQKPNRTLVKIDENRLSDWFILIHLDSSSFRTMNQEDSRSQVEAISPALQCIVFFMVLGCYLAQGCRFSYGICRWWPCFGLSWEFVGVCSSQTRLVWLYKKCQSHRHFRTLTRLSLTLSLSALSCIRLYLYVCCDTVDLDEARRVLDIKVFEVWVRQTLSLAVWLIYVDPMSMWWMWWITVQICAVWILWSAELSESINSQGSETCKETCNDILNHTN